MNPRRSRWACAAVTAALVLASTACSDTSTGDGEARRDEPSAPSTTRAPDSAPSTSDDPAEISTPWSVPVQPYIAVLVEAAGGDKQVDFYGLDGSLLDTSPFPTYDTWFIPSDSLGNTGSFELDASSLAPDFLSAAGTVTFDFTDRVPAVLSLKTGEVNLQVEPPDRTGFESVDPVNYANVEYNPVTGSLWGFLVDPDADYRARLVNISTGDRGSVVEDWDGKEFAFTADRDEPLLITQFSDPPEDALVQSAPESLTSSTDYRFDTVHLDEAGTGAFAFVAADPDLEGRTLFSWDGSGTPEVVAEIDDGSAMTVVGFTTDPATTR